jgi:hypothetical protein
MLRIVAIICALCVCKYIPAAPVGGVGVPAGAPTHAPSLGGPIAGGDDIRYYADNSAPAATLTAASNQPAGTTFSWSVSTGGDKLKINPPSTGSSVSVSGTAASVAPGKDVTVQLVYALGTKHSTVTKKVSVREPCSIVDITFAAPGQVLYPPDTGAYGFGPGVEAPGSSAYENVGWELLDQLGAPMGGVTVVQSWDGPSQAADNASNYANLQPGGQATWMVASTDSSTTLKANNIYHSSKYVGYFDSLDNLQSNNNGRDSTGAYIWTFKTPAFHDVGTETHNFHAPSASCPALKPGYLTAFSTNQATFPGAVTP